MKAHRQVPHSGDSLTKYVGWIWPALDYEMHKKCIRQKKKFERNINV